MFFTSILATGLSALVLFTSAVPVQELLETRDATSDTIGAYDTSLKQAGYVAKDTSSHAVDVAHAIKKRDDDNEPNVSLVLSLLEGHGFQPETASPTVSTSTNKATTIRTTTTASPTRTTTKSTTIRTTTMTTPKPTTSTTKVVPGGTLTTKAASTTQTTKIVTATATAKAHVTVTTKATTTTSATKASITAKTTAAAPHARDFS